MKSGVFLAQHAALAVLISSLGVLPCSADSAEHDWDVNIVQFNPNAPYNTQYDSVAVLQVLNSKVVPMELPPAQRVTATQKLADELGKENLDHLHERAELDVRGYDARKATLAQRGQLFTTIVGLFAALLLIIGFAIQMWPRKVTQADLINGRAPHRPSKKVLRREFAEHLEALDGCLLLKHVAGMDVEARAVIASPNAKRATVQIRSTIDWLGLAAAEQGHIGFANRRSKDAFEAFVTWVHMTPRELMGKIRLHQLREAAFELELAVEACAPKPACVELPLYQFNKPEIVHEELRLAG